MAILDTAEVREREKGLERSLGSAQQAMIALGGAVGVGLFLGSAATIGLAGPGVLVTHLLASLVALILGFALAEMATVYPVAGSFGVYAERYIGPFTGFAMRLTYWFAHTLAIGAQMTAIGVYFAHWFPEVPAGVWVFSFSSLLVVLNALSVRSFANLEFAFSTIKVLTVLAFIIIGAGLLFGAGARPALDNLLGQGGLFPKGLLGVWLPLSLMITNFISVEGVAVTAGEAEHPEKTVPRALLGLIITLFLLYGLALLIMLSLRPWSALGQAGGTLTGSPFVRLFEDVGLVFASDVMNVVVISAAFTGANALLYLCARMFFSLSRSGH